MKKPLSQMKTENPIHMQGFGMFSPGIELGSTEPRVDRGEHGEKENQDRRTTD